MSVTSTLVHRAEIRFHEAADALRPYVGCFWVVTAEQGATIHVVPDGSTAISIQLQNGRPSGWFLRGPLIRPEDRRFPSPALLVGQVCFYSSRSSRSTSCSGRSFLSGIT